MKASGSAPLFVLLRWEHPDELTRVCEERRRQHLGFVAGLLSASLRDGPLGRDGTRLLARLAELPDEGVARILGAPQVSHALCTHEQAPPEVLVRLLDQALEAEHLRSRPDRPAPRELWTALGDLRFEPGQAGPTLRARLVDERFIIDHDSPYRDARLVESEFRPEFGEAVAFSAEQRALVDERIAAATAGLRAVSPAAYSLAASMIRTVMPRIDERNPTFKGSSNRAMVGRVNLFNPQLDYINPGVIASSLVHEAIHILLYLFEQRAPLVTDERRAHEVRITSPWSGKRVDLLAIVHASFVWHALLHLWRRPGIEEHFAQREVLYYRTFCARGLHQQRLSAALGEHAKLVRPDVLEQLVQMQATAPSERIDAGEPG
ncbi:MAG: HEXXH motif-containing putative peptide modification protein [Nannocystaceae bacterium]